MIGISTIYGEVGLMKTLKKCMEGILYSSVCTYIKYMYICVYMIYIYNDKKNQHDVKSV